MARTVAQMIPRPFFVTPLLAREVSRKPCGYEERQFRSLFGDCGAPLTAPNIVKGTERGLSTWCLLRWALGRAPIHNDPIWKEASRQENAAYRKWGTCDRVWTTYRRTQARILLSAFRKVARRYKKMGYKTALKLPGIGKAQLAFLGVKP